MKTLNLKFIILLIGAVSLSACTNLLHTSLDVLRPAKIAFAPESNKLLLVNNTVTQPDELGHKTQLLNQKTKYVLLSSDSLSIFCMAALKEEIEGKNFFTSVKMLSDSKNTGIDFSTISKLDTDTVKKLCVQSQSNVILSLDKIKVNDQLIEYYIPDNNSYLATLELKFETTWSVNYPFKPEATTVHFKDTIYWEGQSYNRKTAVSNLPNRQDALTDGALYVGHKSIDRFIPYWDKVDRYFFDPHNKFMKQGMDSVYVKNWQSAIISWNKAINSTKNSWIQAQAENNIAIAYEITGDIDKALDYATQAYYSMGRLSLIDFKTFLRASNYLGDLTQRKKEITILKNQLDEK